MNLFILNFRSDYKRLKKYIKPEDTIYLTDFSLINHLPKDIKYYGYNDFIEPGDIDAMEHEHKYTYWELIAPFADKFTYNGIELYKLFTISFSWNLLRPIIRDLKVIENIEKKLNIEQVFFCGNTRHEFVMPEHIDIIDFTEYQNRFGLVYFTAYKKKFRIFPPPLFAEIKYYFIKGIFPWTISALRNIKLILSKPKIKKFRKKKFVFLIRTLNHLKYFIPIYNNRRNISGEMEIICDFNLFNSSIVKYMHEQKLDFTVLNAFLDRDSKKQIKRGVKWLRRIYSENEISKQRYYFGKQNFTLCFRYIINDILIKTWFKKAISYIVLGEKMVQALSPEKIILFNEYTILGAALLRVAKNHNIKTIGIQHGALGTENYFYSIDVDKFAVWGNFARDRLVSAGMPANKIFVTGPSAHLAPDGTSSSAEQYNFFGRLAFDENKPLVAFAMTDVLFENGLLALKGVLSAAKRLKTINFLIKLHPGQSEKIIDMILKHINYGKENVRFLKNVDISNVFRSSDLILTSISTAGVEAMMYKKPVIVANFEKDSDRENYIKDAGAVEVFTVQELEAQIQKVLFDEQYRNKIIENEIRYVKKYYRGFTTENLKHIWDLIERD